MIIAEIFCPTPPSIPHTTISPPVDSWQSDFAINTTLAYECHPGFRFIDGTENATVTCDVTGVWVGIDSLADSDRCPVLRVVEHVIVEDGHMNATTGNTERMVCETGYRFTDSSHFASISCGPDLQWEGSIPECERISCPEIGSIPHATLNSTDRLYDSHVTITCDTGYRTQDDVNSLVVRCTETGEWSSNLTSSLCSSKCKQ